ncbi:MAG: hypothetical protein AAF415_19380 [Pseudomonadota bacterium]
MNKIVAVGLIAIVTGLVWYAILSQNSGPFLTGSEPGESTAAPHSGKLAFDAIGVAITPPEGWHILSLGEVARLSNTVDTGSAELNAQFHSPDPSLLATVARDKITRGVNPAITLNYHPGEIVDFQLAFARVSEVLGQMPEFEPLEGPVSDPLGPFDAQYMHYRIAVLSNGIQLDIEEILWLVPMGDHYLTVSVGADVAEAPDLLPTLRRAAHSLERIE